ncbi:hypothetical protein MARINON1_52195 [Marinobacter salarius]|nr:hypothetical protein MARINON1_52195 [Marinobacter salarius]
MFRALEDTHKIAQSLIEPACRPVPFRRCNPTTHFNAPEFEPAPNVNKRYRALSSHDGSTCLVEILKGRIEHAFDPILIIHTVFCRALIATSTTRESSRDIRVYTTFRTPPHAKRCVFLINCAPSNHL